MNSLPEAGYTAGAQVGIQTGNKVSVPRNPGNKKGLAGGN